jgi:two-component system, NtrC family, response regulator AtoC
MDDTANNVLLVDDDAAFRRVYSNLLTGEGLSVELADDRPAAAQAFEEGDFDVVLLDLMLPPDGSVERGLEQLSEFLSARPDTKIIVVSGAGDTRFMVQAVKEGAFDFLTKPVDPDVLLIVVERALTRVRLERQVATLQDSLAETRPDGTMLGQSPAFERAVQMAERVARSELPVLVTGENGTGKELMARSIHEHSPRRDKPFVAVNCGALPENLLESTLFGHKKGSFTGASRDRKGVFAEADGGTLFLDEIGDMPASLQVKLLRTLEVGEIQPVGADRPVTVDVRIISATNRDLDALQEEGAFREDFYWRIKGAEIRLPPLRERPEDIALLARHFLNKAAALAADGKARTLSDSGRDALLSHPWPGNLRELRHEMQRATVMMGERSVLLAEDLSFVGERAAGEQPGEDASLHDKVEALERREIRAALARHDGNRTRTAEALGLSRQGLLNKIERYGL